MWTRVPFLFRNELVAVEGLDEQRPARIGEVKRLGERLTVALTKITKVRYVPGARSSAGTPH